jgi:hypothetical protein
MSTAGLYVHTISTIFQKSLGTKFSRKLNLSNNSRTTTRNNLHLHTAQSLQRSEFTNCNHGRYSLENNPI